MEIVHVLFDFFYGKLNTNNNFYLKTNIFFVILHFETFNVYAFKKKIWLPQYVCMREMAELIA